MNNFETELKELIAKHRDFPGADLHEMINTLQQAAYDLGDEVEDDEPDDDE